VTAPRAPVAVDASSAFGRPRPSKRATAGPGRRAGSFPPLRGLLPLAAALGVWQVVGDPGSPYLPPPSTWVRGLRDLWTSGALRPATTATLTTFVLALVVATVVGALLGVVVGVSPRADRALGPTLEFARALPPAAIVPIAVLLIGYDQKMKVAVVTFAAVWPILLNTRAGVRRLDPVLRDMARSLHLSRLDTARKVTFPALAPSILLGVRVAAPISLVITLLVEIITRVNGLGALITISQRNYQSARVFGLILVAGLFSFLVNGLVGTMEASVSRHRPRA